MKQICLLMMLLLITDCYLYANDEFVNTDFLTKYRVNCEKGINVRESAGGTRFTGLKNKYNVWVVEGSEVQQDNLIWIMIVFKNNDDNKLKQGFVDKSYIEEDKYYVEKISNLNENIELLTEQINNCYTELTVRSIGYTNSLKVCNDTQEALKTKLSKFEKLAGCEKEINDLKECQEKNEYLNSVFTDCKVLLQECKQSNKYYALLTILCILILTNIFIPILTYFRGKYIGKLEMKEL